MCVCVFFLGGFAIAEVVSGFLSNAASSVMKRLWSLKSTTKTGDCWNLSRARGVSPPGFWLFEANFRSLIAMEQEAEGSRW
jgi:hypothetical protein